MTEQKNILVVDDDESLRTVLVDKLTANNFVALGAADGEEGLAKALELHPDLILMDVMMPKMNGWQVLEHLRQDAWGKHAKVIMLTNLGDMESISEGVTRGTFEYLVKTEWSLDDIVKKAQGALEG